MDQKKKVLDNLSNGYYNQPPHNLTSMSFDRYGARTRKTREDIPQKALKRRVIIKFDPLVNQKFKTYSREVN